VLGSISLVFSTCFTIPKSAMSCEMVSKASCCTAKVVVPYVHTRCCHTSAPKQLPLPLDQLKPSSNAGLKDFVAMIGIDSANTNEEIPRMRDDSSAVSSATQSLIVQHIRLQV
jgi:hypothetical protein